MKNTVAEEQSAEKHRAHKHAPEQTSLLVDILVFSESFSGAPKVYKHSFGAYTFWNLLVFYFLEQILKTRRDTYPQTIHFNSALLSFKHERCGESNTHATYTRGS